MLERWQSQFKLENHLLWGKKKRNPRSSNSNLKISCFHKLPLDGTSQVHEMPRMWPLMHIREQLWLEYIIEGCSVAGIKCSPITSASLIPFKVGLCPLWLPNGRARLQQLFPKWIRWHRLGVAEDKSFASKMWSCGKKQSKHQGPTEVTLQHFSLVLMNFRRGLYGS